VWAKQFASFPAAGFRAVAFDSRGHGESRAGSTGHSLDNLADDLRTVLEELDLRDVVLVGHSMGGRTAVRVAGDEGVVGVVALAPWLPKGEPAEQLAGRSLLIAHGTADRVTSPIGSARFAERARVVAARVDLVMVAVETHAMVLRWPTWQRLTTAYVLDLLDVAPLPSRVADALRRGRV